MKPFQSPELIKFIEEQKSEEYYKYLLTKYSKEEIEYSPILGYSVSPLVDKIYPVV